MIELYTWTTANSQKVNIAVSELGLEVVVHPTDLTRGVQFGPELAALNPNAKVPVIVDRSSGIRVFESGAILLYLAERENRLLASYGTARWEAIQWVFWQMAGLGPIGSQFNHFRAEESRGVYARERFADEFRRLLGILDRRLAQYEHVAGAYSIADIAIWPWIARGLGLGFDFAGFGHIRRWYKAVAARPGVIAGYRMLQPEAEVPALG